MNAAPPFHCGAGWFAAWRAAYAPGDGADVGGLPLIRDTARAGPLRYRILRSATNLHTARFDRADPPPAATLLAAGAHVVELDYVPEGSRLLGYPGAAIEPRARTPVADCDDAERWLAARPKRERQRLRRLDRDCAYRFAVDRGDGDLDALIGRLFTLEAAGWKGRAGTAIQDSVADAAFYRLLAHEAARAGVLRVALLLDGDRVAAFEYGVLGGDRLFVLKAGYDERDAASSPGHVLAFRHIRACCADPAIACYDVLGNGMTPAPHLLRFADRTETLYRVRLYARGPRGVLLRAAFAVRAAARAARRRWRR